MATHQQFFSDGSRDSRDLELQVSIFEGSVVCVLPTTLKGEQGRAILDLDDHIRRGSRWRFECGCCQEIDADGLRLLDHLRQRIQAQSGTFQLFGVTDALLVAIRDHELFHYVSDR